jgi:predicted nucleotidyltransferase component of viral defense system
MEPPRLKAYTLESVIAEKFQAGIYLAEANSRMKDFYDIYELSQSFEFDGVTLYEAVKQTFERRKTEMPQVPTIFKEDFASIPDKQTQWRAFQRRMAVAEGKDFATVLAGIKGFLSPLYAALSKGQGFEGKWNHKTHSWNKA